MIAGKLTIAPDAPDLTVPTTSSFASFSVKVYWFSTLGALLPESTPRVFCTGMVTSTEAALYVLVKITAPLPPLTVALMVPSELSLTTTLTVFVAVPSLVTPSSEPDSVTV